MMLLTEENRKALLANGASAQRAGHDPHPVVKLFNPAGAATWLLTELDPEDPDVAFGLCDLGHGFPELGSVSLSEISAVRGPLGLGIERDRGFKATQPLSKYAELARAEGRIVA